MVGLPITGIRKGLSLNQFWDVLWEARFSEAVPVISYELFHGKIVLAIGDIEKRIPETYVAFGSALGEMLGCYATRDEAVRSSVVLA